MENRDKIQKKDKDKDNNNSKDLSLNGSASFSKAALKFVNDLDLVDQAKKLVEQERKLTAKILIYFQEIESRRIYAARGYSSMHEFVVEILKYSDGATHRRINASRVLNIAPQIKSEFESGSFNLTTLCQAQNFFKAQKISNTEEKKEILEKIKDKSSRKIEKIFLEMAPLDIPKDKERRLTPELTEVKFVMTRALEEKLDKIKNLFSHKNPNPTFAELLDIISDIALKTLERQKMPREGREVANTSAPKFAKNSSRRRGSRERYIPQNLKRSIWQSAEGKCSFQDPVTGKKCESKFQLEYDHVMPLSRGGLTTKENLRLYCKTHNLYAATKVFGPKHMAKFIST